MIYIVQIYEDGRVTKEFEIEGLEKAQRLRDFYEGQGYSTELNPDVYAYLKKYGSLGKTPASKPAA